MHSPKPPTQEKYGVWGAYWLVRPMRCLELGVWLKKRDQAKVVFVLLEATGLQKG